MRDYTVVEGMLPARMMTEIGIYLQTAAHLELAIWQIVMYADGKTDPKREELVKFLEVKNVTRKLVAELKRIVPKVPLSLAPRVLILTKSVEAGLISRNLAAHGTFYIDDVSGNLMVCHFYPTRKGNEREWLEVTSSISSRTISTAIEAIFLLLREAIAIRSSLSHGQSPSFA